MEQKYSIAIEEDVKRDIRNILSHYEYDLQLPNIGLKIISFIHQKINHLSTTPKTSPVYDLPGSSRAIRVIHERKYKYNIYYTVDESKKKVHILRIFHARQSQIIS